MRINEIKEHKKNPRLIKGKKFDDLVRSLVTFPEMMELRPIVVDNDNVVLGGNMRLRALKYIQKNRDKAEALIDDVKEDARRKTLLKYWADFSKTGEVKTVKADELSEVQKREFIIKDNAAFGEWDWDALANEWESSDLNSWGVDVWESVEEDAKASEEEELEEDAPVEIDEGAEADTQKGDIFYSDGNYLICGDSTLRATYEAAERIMGKRIQADMLLTDPPYNVNYKGGGRQEREGITNDNISEDNFSRFLAAACTNANERLKAGAALYIWMSVKNRDLFVSAFKGVAGWHYSQELIWVKSHFVLGRSDYNWKHEACIYGYKEGASHYFIGYRNKSTLVLDEISDLFRNPKLLKKDELVALCEQLQDELQKVHSDVLRAYKPINSDSHPTMKPLKLYGKCITNSSRKGETVLDMFAGSGTTMIACRELERKSICIELMPIYCDVIRARYKQNFGVEMERIGNILE